jgi:membrane-associated phospholipid phosphatase
VKAGIRASEAEQTFFRRLGRRARAATSAYTFVDYTTQAYTALVGGLILCFHNSTVPHWPGLFGAHVGLLVAVHLLVERQARRPARGVFDFLRHFYPVLLYTGFFAETGWLNRMFFTQYLDPTAIGWDQALFGCQPSVAFMEKLPYLALSEIFYAAYFSYYLMIGGVGLALFLRDRQQFFHYVSVVSFVFYICYLIYIVLPIIGPPVFFHHVPGYALPEAVQRLATTDVYPESVKAGLFFRLMAFIYRVFEAPGAALPSSHVAVALCTVFFSFRYLRGIRYWHLGTAFLLCLATIYCRYHYGVDVIAGILTAALLVPLGNWLYFKFRIPQLETPAAPQSVPPASALSASLSHTSRS